MANKKREDIKRNFKRFWHWLWDSDSFWSYVVLLVIIFLAVKFIFLPGLSLAFGMGLNGLPLAIVESESMNHDALSAGNENYEICGKNLNEGGFLNSDEYWDTCGNWYEEQTNITKSEFSKFSFSNGFRKGDLIIIFGRDMNNIKIGDVIIFATGRAHPLIHRVISTNPLETKGDHNPGQLLTGEETNIQKNQIIGVAVARIPYVGWIKLFFVELWNSFK